MVYVIVQYRMFLDVLQRYMVPVCRHDLYGEGAGEGGDTAGFPLVDVASAVGEDGMRGLGEVGADGELVAHCSGEDEEGGGMAG